MGIVEPPNQLIQTNKRALSWVGEIIQQVIKNNWALAEGESLWDQCDNQGRGMDYKVLRPHLQDPGNS